MHKHNKGPRRKRPDQSQGSEESSRTEPSVDQSSPIVQQFLGYQKELDTRHDKHERLLKLGRDVTIDSKRTIFLLQRISGESDKENIIQDAKKRLCEIQKTKWRPIAEELHNEDPYRFLRAYSPGLQEYIEALSFCHFLEFGMLISLEDVEATLKFPAKDGSDGQEKAAGGTEEYMQLDPASEVEADPSSRGQPPGAKEPVDEIKESEASSKGAKSVPPEGSVCPPGADSQGTVSTLGCGSSGAALAIHVPPTEFMLGVADLTGELMRRAIHSVGQGDLKLPYKLCSFLREVYDAFLLFGNTNRELNRKMFTLRQSLHKVEAACYTLQVRGSEIPQHMLAEAIKTVGVTMGSEGAMEETM